VGRGLDQPWAPASAEETKGSSRSPSQFWASSPLDVLLDTGQVTYPMDPKQFLSLWSTHPLLAQVSVQGLPESQKLKRLGSLWTLRKARRGWVSVKGGGRGDGQGEKGKA
jgi:hypothetical protein